MKIKFDVNKQQLHRKDNEILASFSRNLIRCEFFFDDTWIDVYKYVLFTDSNSNQTIVDMGIEQVLSCKVPEEMLKGNYFLVSVFGGDRITSTQETVLLGSSGFSEELEENLSNGILAINNNSYDSLDYYKTHKERCKDKIYRRNIFEEQEHPYFE